MEFQFERPYLPLFYALRHLAGVEECEAEVQSLTARLTKLFEDVPEKNGEKRAGGLIYRPNGLCYHSRSPNENPVILPPWESEFFRKMENEEQTGTTTMLKGYLGRKMVYDPLVVIREAVGRGIWYYQYALYKNRRFSVERKFRLSKLLQLKSEMEKLAPENRKVLDIDEIDYQLREEARDLHRLLRSSSTDFDRHASEKFLVFFLSPQELQEIDELINSSLEVWPAVNRVRLYLQTLIPENRPYLEYDLNEWYKPLPDQSHWWTSREVDPDTPVPQKIREFVESVTEPEYRRIFKRLGLI